MNARYDYSLIIPVYNSEKTLKELFFRIKTVFVNLPGTYEIIFIDDYSTDNSYKILNEIYTTEQDIKILRLSRNFGQHNALMCGFNQAQGKYIITLDDDLQHPPEEIPNLIRAIENDPYCDVIIGKPIKKEHSFFRNLVSFLGNCINSYIYSKPIDIKMGSFRIIRKEIINELIEIKIPNPTIGPLILSITKNIKNIPMIHLSREKGHSQYSLKRIIKISFDNLTYNSILPLKIIGTFGVLIALFSFVYGTYLIIKYFLTGCSLIGWTSLIVVNLFLFGVTIATIGMISIYLIQIINATNGSKQYIIKERKM